MSWLDKLNTELIIQTGDGSKYNPKWIPKNKQIEYNIAQYEFIEVQGSYVKRSQRIGNKYTLEVIFDGDDHLDIADNFEKSSDDKNPWIITHPYYGELLVHPTSINRQNENYNITRFVISVIETITDNFPKQIISLPESIALQKEESNDIVSASVPDGNATQSQLMRGELDVVESKYDFLIETDEDQETFRNLLSNAKEDAVNLISNTELAFRSTINCIDFPILLEQPIELRLKSLKNYFDELTSTIDNILFEKLGGAIISAMCYSSSVPIEGDYDINSDVYSVLDQIIDYNDRYLTEIDSRQSDRADTPTSYVPEYNSIDSINRIVSTTIANLFNIAFNSKIEYSIILENNSNAIILSHRFYGQSEDDSNLESFIAQNDLSSNELFQIEKGRLIKYYR